MDQTGQFPVKLSGGNQYIMVTYVHDANAILDTLLKRNDQKPHSLRHTTKYTTN